MTNILSIATSVPSFKHKQKSILDFMQKMYSLAYEDARKLGFLYNQSDIEYRYSLIEDFSNSKEAWTFIPINNEQTFPNLEARMELYNKESLVLSTQAIENCINNILNVNDVTHLITVSCTGMSAPGLDLAIVEAMDMPSTVQRTSVNFMGCYAAIHALKMAFQIAESTPNANIVIVATELCTLHFQKEYSVDGASSSMLFADGCAAVLISNNKNFNALAALKFFFSKVNFSGKKDMAWQLSSQGFLMTLTGYIPQFIEADIETLVNEALQNAHLTKQQITHWCIHPGGKKIIDVIQKKLQLSDEDVKYSRTILKQYGNMSSPTILFVLNEILQDIKNDHAIIFGIAFGPGLTMETFIAVK